MPGVSDHAGLNASRAIDAPSIAFRHPDGVGVPEDRSLAMNLISWLNTQPMRTPVNASLSPLRVTTHDSEPVWIATPSLYGSFIRYTLPVSPAHQDSGLNIYYNGFMKILFLTTWYPTKIIQSLEFIKEHAKAVSLFNDVIVLHSSAAILNLKGLYRIEKETDERITEGILTYRVWRKKLPIKIMSYLNFNWSIVKGFKYIISSGFKPDIIHAHIYEAGVPAVLIGKLYNIPVVITEHSSSFTRKLLSKFEIFKANLAFRWAKVVMPVSNALQKGIQDYGINVHFCVIPNAVNTTLFYYNPHLKEVSHRKRILFVGLLVPVKGLPFLFNALAQLKLKREDWHLDIIGDGPERKIYEKIVKDLGLSKQITFHGLKSKAEVASFMQKTDLFVLPSLFETFSVVTAEALVTGIPVLVTNCGGPEEFVTEDVGLVIPSGNSEALYVALDYMLNNLEQYDSNYISNYATNKFSPENVGKQLQNIYLECLEKYK
jgi:glycosyltransferase involved in cell wall biosynthesis